MYSTVKIASSCDFSQSLVTEDAIFRIGWKWKGETALQARINASSLFLFCEFTLFFSKTRRAVASTPALSLKEEYFPCKFSLASWRCCVAWQKKKREETVHYKSIVVPAAYACLQLKWTAWEVYAHDLWNCCRPVGTDAAAARPRHAEHVFMLSRVSCHARN